MRTWAAWLTTEGERVKRWAYMPGGRKGETRALLPAGFTTVTMSSRLSSCRYDLDFTAIDFETANSYRGSPCSVGLVKVRDGQIVDESSTLIHPPARFDYFDGFNTSLHGINAEMVAVAPRWQQAADWIVRYTGSDTLVCHNAGFDIGVIRYACMADDIPWPSVDFLCTLVLARRAWRLPSYRLPFVAAQCDLDFHPHHQASDDAHCAARIAVAMARKQGAQTLADLAWSFGVSIGHMETGHYAPSVWRSPGTWAQAHPARREPGRRPRPPLLRQGHRVHRGADVEDWQWPGTTWLRPAASPYSASPNAPTSWLSATLTLPCWRQA